MNEPSNQPAATNAIARDRPGDWVWGWWFLVPIYPYGRRRTLRREVVKDTVWIFEQTQGIFSVVVPIRMTVVRLAAGGLLVYAPIAPTRECLRLLQDLVALHGTVRYIILPTTSGLEHKVFVPPFARHFPQAQIFIAPAQWSFPFNLPLSWLGFPMGRTQILPENPAQTPFFAEFDYAILGPLGLGLGTFGEVAFFHRPSRTLLVTDIVVSVPQDPPQIVQLDPQPLLYHAKEDPGDRVEDTAITRRKGWQRIALFAFYFRPSVLDVVDLLPAIRDAFQASDRAPNAYFGFYPFRWQEDWKQSFEALRNGGRLLVAPILQTLILNRSPKQTLNWANHVAGWAFEQIIPCHFDAPVQADPQQFRQAFAFLKPSPAEEGGAPPESYPLPAADFALLKEIDRTLIQRGIVPPPADGLG